MTIWTHKISWGSLAWAIGGASSWVTLSGTTEVYSAIINLLTDGYEFIEFFPEVDFDSTPTDDVELNIYGDRDGDDANPDDTTVNSMVIDKDTDPHQISAKLPFRSYYKFGMKQTGSTDSHNVRLSYRLGRRTSTDA